MPSLIYNSCLADMARGNIDFDTDSFFVMLTTAAYAEDRDAHGRRSNVTSEVAGTGYTAGGQAVPVTVTRDDVNDRVDIAFGAVTWAASTITARKAVIYKRRGGAASADELVAVNDFNVDVTSTGAAFTLGASTLRLQG